MGELSLSQRMNPVWEAHVGLGACQRMHFKTWEAYGNMLIHPSLFEERTDNLGIIQ